MNPSFWAYIKSQQEIINKALKFYLPKEEGFASRLLEAMHYSLFAGGKRLRPILLLTAAGTIGGNPKDYLPAACALECIHTYSLIHDDLPAMDNDDLRRGKPTCHKAFDEATAILAGDALLTYAFELLSHPDLISKVPEIRVLKVIRLIAQAAGVKGMVAGQMADLLAEGKTIEEENLEFIHLHKTAFLLMASVVSGGVLAGANPLEEESLRKYGLAIGKAFQIVDDLLDITGDEKILGKPVGSDQAKGKATYPALYGVDSSRKRALSLLKEALEALQRFGSKAKYLKEIAIFIVERKL